jgi:hypothetical protein
MDGNEYHIYTCLVFLFLLGLSVLRNVLFNSVSVAPKIPAERLGADDCFDKIIRFSSMDTSRCVGVVDKLPKFVDKGEQRRIIRCLLRLKN